MKGFSKKQSQFELFPSAKEPSTEKACSAVFPTGIKLSLDNIVVLGVVIIISMILSFSIGVEKGKRRVKAQQTQKIKHVAQTVLYKPIQTAEAIEQPQIKEAALIPSINVPIQEAADERKIDENFPLEKVVDKLYTVQVASFKQEQSAQQEAMTLKQKGYDIFVLPKGNYSIVCVGKFAQRTEAKSFSKKLKNRYKDLLVRSL